MGSVLEESPLPVDPSAWEQPQGIAAFNGPSHLHVETVVGGNAFDRLAGQDLREKGVIAAEKDVRRFDQFLKAAAREGGGREARVVIKAPEVVERVLRCPLQRTRSGEHPQGHPQNNRMPRVRYLDRLP